MHGWHCYICKTYPPDKLSKLRTTGLCPLIDRIRGLTTNDNAHSNHAGYCIMVNRYQAFLVILIVTS